MGGHRCARQVAGRDVPRRPRPTGTFTPSRSASSATRSNSDELKPYFEFNKVLNDGVFYAANQLYGITFKERKDIPTWNPDMRVFEVFDKDGKPLALFYIDPWKRDNKGGGAWMANLVNQSYLRGTKPVDLQRRELHQARGRPAGADQLGRRDDDVPRVRPRAARHVRGADLSDPVGHERRARLRRVPVAVQRELGARSQGAPALCGALPDRADDPAGPGRQDQAARTFNQGYEIGEALEAARLDLDWHSLPATRRGRTSTSSRRRRWPASGFDIADVPPRYRSSYFLHIWSSGYSAGYYAYPWTRMLGQDAFNWFESHGGLTRANGQRFRDMVLSRGNTLDLCRDVPRLRRPRSRHPAVSRILRPDRRRSGSGRCRDGAAAAQPPLRIAAEGRAGA